MLANYNAIEDSGGYGIERSLRCNAASSQSLSRTPSVAGNQRIWSWSGLVKLGTLTSPTGIFEAGSTSNNTSISFNSNCIIVQDYATTSYNIVWQTLSIFRDPSAWYHIVVIYNTTEATAANAVKVYVNGVQQSLSFTAFAGSYLQNRNSFINGNIQHRLGTYNGLQNYLDGYLSEVNFIDGQALTPSSFGEINPVTGQWVAKEYTGTYGTNGGYLDFKDGTSTTTLGHDKSGNNNHWTLTNFTRSAGVNDCWMLDVPSGNGGLSGVQPSGNYAVLNPLNGAGARMANGNLNITNTLTGGEFHKSTILLPTSGKYYFEAVSTAFSATFTIVGWFGVSTGNDAFTGYLSRTTVGSGGWYADGVLQSSINFGALNDVWGIAVDAGAKTVSIYLNNVLKGSVSYTAAEVFFVYGTYTSGTGWANFGQRSFAYTPPTGFKALCTSNLPTPTIKRGDDYFDVETYVGTGASNKRTLRFKPDFLWTKRRSAVEHHWLVDVIRGVSKGLYSNLTNAEATQATCVSSFDSDGYTLGTDSAGYTNVSGQSYVGWAWKGGGAPVTNNVGSISSQVSANPTAGFSVVTYTGTGVNATVGHGLGIAPKFILAKARQDAVSWLTYNINIGASNVLFLNATNAQTSSPTTWNSTAPTSSVFSLGTDTSINQSTKTYVAYCFAEIAGYSKFGSYTGNGSADGPFVYLGFKPKWLLVKRTDVLTDWILRDLSRSPFNVIDDVLYPNLVDAEGTNAAFNIDFVSSGFKVRDSWTGLNASGGTYIYMAFAETPFQYANAR